MVNSFGDRYPMEYGGEGEKIVVEPTVEGPVEISQMFMEPLPTWRANERRRRRTLHLWMSAAAAGWAAWGVLALWILIT